jgi:nucleoside-diphosphate kinase
MKEYTLVLLKPDVYQRNLVGKVIDRFTDTGLEIWHIESVFATSHKVWKHYSHLSEQIIREIVSYFCLSLTPSGRNTPLIAIVMYGEDAISVCRKVCGDTDCSKADAGTVRGDFGVDSLEMASNRQKSERAIRNLVHSSDSEDSFVKEVSIWCPRFRSSSFTLNEKVRIENERDA